MLKTAQTHIYLPLFANFAEAQTMADIMYLRGQYINHLNNG